MAFLSCLCTCFVSLLIGVAKIYFWMAEYFVRFVLQFPTPGFKVPPVPAASAAGDSVADEKGPPVFTAGEGVRDKVKKMEEVILFFLMYWRCL